VIRVDQAESAEHDGNGSSDGDTHGARRDPLIPVLAISPPKEPVEREFGRIDALPLALDHASEFRHRLLLSFRRKADLAW
jgi:hypothetical protein